MADLWDKQPGESAKQFARFEEYRAMGPRRTLEAVYRAETGRKGVAPGRWRAESARWRWRERAEAWDAAQTARARQAEADALESRRKVWVAQAQGIQSKAVSRLLSIPTEEMSFRDVIAAISVGMKLEMLALEQPTEIARQQHAGQVQITSIEAIDPLAQRVLDDPEAADLACRLLERVTSGQEEEDHG